MALDSRNYYWWSHSISTEKKLQISWTPVALFNFRCSIRKQSVLNLWFYWSVIKYAAMMCIVLSHHVFFSKSFHLFHDKTQNKVVCHFDTDVWSTVKQHVFLLLPVGRNSRLEELQKLHSFAILRTIGSTVVKGKFSFFLTSLLSNRVPSAAISQLKLGKLLQRRCIQCMMYPIHQVRR